MNVKIIITSKPSKLKERYLREENELIRHLKFRCTVGLRDGLSKSEMSRTQRRAAERLVEKDKLTKGKSIYHTTLDVRNPYYHLKEEQQDAVN